MSSFCGSVLLLVLLGVVSAFGNPIQSGDELSQIHESIANVLELKNSEISTHPLFSSVINSINTSCQRKEEIQLMNVTIDVYMRIFSSILENDNSLLGQLQDRSEVRSHLRKLQEKMQEMKGRLNHLSQQRHNKEDVLRKLNKIKVDDPKDQKRALAQFIEIYRAASKISRSCGSAHSSSTE
uniref:interferon gamma 1-like n=1 Tax=Semicossyphus pulcher TaxID=241346 RepID=UPI0037E87E9C